MKLFRIIPLILLLSGGAGSLRAETYQEYLAQVGESMGGTLQLIFDDLVDQPLCHIGNVIRSTYGGNRHECDPIKRRVMEAADHAFKGFLFQRLRVQGMCGENQVNFMYNSGLYRDDRVQADMNLLGDSTIEFALGYWDVLLQKPVVKAGFGGISSQNLLHWLRHCTDQGQPPVLAPRTLLVIGGNDFEEFRAILVAAPYLLSWRRNHVLNNIHRIATWHAQQNKKMALMGNIPPYTLDPRLHWWVYIYEIMDQLERITPDLFLLGKFFAPWFAEQYEMTAQILARIDSYIAGGDLTFTGRQLHKLQPEIDKIAAYRGMPRLQLWEYFRSDSVPFPWVAGRKWYEGPWVFPSGMDNKHLNWNHGYPRMAWAMGVELAKFEGTGYDFLGGQTDPANTHFVQPAAGIPNENEIIQPGASDELVIGVGGSDQLLETLLFCFLIGFCG